MTVINGGVLDGVRQIGPKFRDVSISGGLPGAPLGLRIRGGGLAGPPAAGTWRPGDVWPDRNGVIWTCTAGGTPGTWVQTPVIDSAASDIQPVGASAVAGNSGKAADAKHVHVGLLPSNNLSDLGSTATALNNLGLASIPWMPSDDSLLGANYDPAGGITTQSSAATSRLYLMRVTVRIAQNFNYVWLLLQAAGSGTSTGSYVCVYSSSGSQLAISADIGTSVQTTGPVKLALTSAAAATTPFVWVGMVFLGMTPPTIYRGAASSPVVNLNTTAANLRFAVNGTTAAASITPSSNTATNAVPWWCGVS